MVRPPPCASTQPYHPLHGSTRAMWQLWKAVSALLNRAERLKYFSFHCDDVINVESVQTLHVLPRLPWTQALSFSIAKEILIIRESLPAYFISNVRHVQWTIPQKCNEGSMFSLFDWQCFHDEKHVFFFSQGDYGCYDLSLRRPYISFHLLHILLFIEPLLSAHYRHLYQQPDLRSKIDLFFQFWHKPIWEYLGKAFYCKIL